MLALEIDVRTKIDNAPDRPTESDSDRAADKAHGAGFGEEEAAHISITGAEGLHDSNFAAAFEDVHHQRVHDADGSYGQCKASEDRKERVEHGKKLAHTAGRI